MHNGGRAGTHTPGSPATPGRLQAQPSCPPGPGAPGTPPRDHLAACVGSALSSGGDLRDGWTKENPQKATDGGVVAGARRPHPQRRAFFIFKENFFKKRKKEGREESKDNENPLPSPHP